MVMIVLCCDTERAGHAHELVKDLVLTEWYGIVIVSGDGLVFEVCFCYWVFACPPFSLPPRSGVWNIAMSVSVCLSRGPFIYPMRWAFPLSVGLYLSVPLHTSKKTCPNFTKFSVPVAWCGRGPPLTWRRCNTLCTSGFVDDATFAHSGSGLYGTWLIGRTLKVTHRGEERGRSVMSAMSVT